MVAVLRVISIVAVGVPVRAAAQNITSYFPAGVGGFDQGLGVTVLSRLRPAYDLPPIRIDGFMVSPTLDESLLYNSSVTGIAGSGSWGERTSASIGATSDWERNRLSGTIGFSNSDFFALPHDGFTDWNIGLGGGYTINDSQLEAAYSHATYHQIGVVIGQTTSQTPAIDQTDTAHAGYTFNFGPYAITPDISATAYHFGTATVQGLTQNQNYLNRDVVAGGVTGRYSRSDEGGLLVVLRGVNSTFTSPQSGQPSDNSHSAELLGGFDYQGESVWRYRVLIGVEVRAFQASQYPTHTAPLVEGSAIWTPTGLTTVTGTLSRDIEDPASSGTNGYTLTQARVVLDHELLVNVFLQARGGIQYAEYLQRGGGTQTSLGVGGSVSWLISPRIRLGLNYDFTDRSGNSVTTNTHTLGTSIIYPGTQSLAVLAVHLAL